MPSLDPKADSHGYTLIRRLGKGNFGEVWEARSPPPGNFAAALKIIYYGSSQIAAQVELESLSALQTLKHPFMVHIHNVWVDPDRVVIAMQLADGNLRQRLQYCREKECLQGIPPDELLHYMREASQAVDYLHREKKLHRDIKPDNIFLQNGHALLGDCGLLRDMTDTAGNTRPQGTPPYIAPEVWLRKGCSPKSDQYSLAVSYVELRQGRRPFEGTDKVSLEEFILHDDPKLLGLEAEEKDILRRALAKNPEGRFPTCLAMIEGLERALRIMPGSFNPPARVALAPNKTAESSIVPQPQQLDTRQRVAPTQISPPAAATGMAPDRGGHLVPPTQEPSSEWDVIDSESPEVRSPAPSPPPPRRQESQSPGTLPEPAMGSLPGSNVEDRRRTRQGGTLLPEHEGTLREDPRLDVTPGWKHQRDPGSITIQEEQESPPSPSILRWVGPLLILLVVGLGGGYFTYTYWNSIAEWFKTPGENGGGPIVPSTDTITLTLPSPNWVSAGQVITLHLTTEGKAKDIENRLRVAPAPGLEIQKPRVSDGKFELLIQAAPTATVGKRLIELSTAIEEKDAKPKILFQTPDGTKTEKPQVVMYVLPAGFEPVPGGEPGPLGYPGIRKRIGSEEVIFHLQQPNKPEPSAYYLMENKVWNSLFASFAKEKLPEQNGWKLGGIKNGMNVTPLNPKHPVFRVTRPQAEAFAHWLGGELPTSLQLDQAAGFFDQRDRKSPARGNRIAVNRRVEGPMAVDEATDDVAGETRIRWLTSNGREWTRDPVLVAGKEEVAILRAQSYTAPRGLLYSDLEEMRNQRGLVPTQYPDKGSPYTSFRVVIEIPRE